jgi:GTP pyrophosphokinase
MVRLTDILDKVKSYHPGADTDLINKAYVYSARMHEGQTRKSGDPYFIHPVSVASIIADMRLDTASVCAALLHDVVEDTGASDDDMRQLFGEEVAFLVDGVTKLGRINFTCKEDQQAESFRKMLVAMARDIRVLLVKLADRLDNMRTLEHMKPDTQERIARETVEIYAPLAGRLGIHWLKAELEDLSFKHLYPEAWTELTKKVKRGARDSDRYIDDVTKRLQKMLIERGFAVDVQGRVKHLYSIWRKMRRQNIDFEQVQDFVAFRVLMENVADCYAALGVVHSQWTPVPGRFKDYIALPKPNLYQSLHTTVIGPGHRRIEVQIRTHEMHRTAEFGIAAHWKYKQNTGGLDAKDAARFAWLRQLMEFQKEVADPAEFLDSVKVDLFSDEVYVFTPKGDVKTFPRGSTPLDFAYAIHSEVGDHCVGARVNGAMVPLRYKLHNGDVVEILTSNSQHPGKDWLDYAATGKARSKIRNFIRLEERKRGMKIGRDLLEREMRKGGLSMGRFLKGDRQKVLERYGVGNDDDLFAQIGYGKVQAASVVDFIAPKDDQQARKSLTPGIIERTVDKVRKKDGEGILIEGMDDVMVRFARCCNPLPGDAVTGWITRGRGVTVHRHGCTKAMELDPERRVDVGWSGSANVQLPVSMRVVTADRPGILANVSSAFTESGVNITEANCRTSSDGRAVNVFQFTVGDVTKLKTLMRSIQRIDGVYDVERV